MRSCFNVVSNCHDKLTSNLLHLKHCSGKCSSRTRWDVLKHQHLKVRPGLPNSAHSPSKTIPALATNLFFDDVCEDSPPKTPSKYTRIRWHAQLWAHLFQEIKFLVDSADVQDDKKTWQDSTKVHFTGPFGKKGRTSLKKHEKRKHHFDRRISNQDADFF